MSSSPLPGPGGQPSHGVREFGDVAERVVAVLRLRRPRVQRVTLIVLGVLAAVCVAATLTRLSPLPLLPLAPFGAAAFACWRASSADSDRQVVGWSAVTALATAVGFWLLGFVGRIL
ncbi:hypothetical protein BAY59_31540 [Prauserella coralliicola]|nr:hypothetical protein BAY59_31540 [Prauserella coralliicola]